MITQMATYFDILLSFGKIGMLSFGGGTAMLQMIEFEAVANRNWITQSEFSQIAGSTFLFPGLTAVKLSTIIGFQVGGILGGVIAFLSINIPGIVTAIIGFYLLKYHENKPGIQKLIVLVQYGALALLVASVYTIAAPVVKSNFSLLYALGAVVLLAAMIVWNISPFLGLFAYICILYFF